MHNANPFRDTKRLEINTSEMYEKSERGATMMFKESQIWNPIGPPSMNTGDFRYLSSYSNAKRKAEKMNKSFYTPSTPGNTRKSCWQQLSDEKVGLGVSGLPALTDARLGQQKLNNELNRVRMKMTSD